LVLSLASTSVLPTSGPYYCTPQVLLHYLLVSGNESESRQGRAWLINRNAVYSILFLLLVTL
jgi:hypothetical protein